MPEQFSPKSGFDGQAFPVAQTLTGFANMTATQTAKAVAPISKHCSLIGSHCCTLASRRMSAWSEHHKRLLASKDPADVFECTQAFWQRFMQDYVAFNQSAMQAWLGAWNGAIRTLSDASPAGSMQLPLGPERDELPLRGAAEGSIRESDPRRVDAVSRAA